MRMNRRNVLVGLGTIVAGGGAALGTGAFSTVKADRTVNVDTAGDASAFLAIEGNSDYVDASSDTVQIDLGSYGSQQGNGFNENAVTTVEGVLKVTNQGSSNGVTIEFAQSIDDTSTTPSETITVQGVGDVTFKVDDTDGNNTLEALNSDGSNSDAASVAVDITIDTTVDASSGSGSIVIVADTS